MGNLEEVLRKLSTSPLASRDKKRKEVFKCERALILMRCRYRQSYLNLQCIGLLVCPWWSGIVLKSFAGWKGGRRRMMIILNKDNINPDLKETEKIIWEWLAQSFNSTWHPENYRPAGKIASDLEPAILICFLLQPRPVGTRNATNGGTYVRHWKQFRRNARFTSSLPRKSTSPKQSSIM